MKLKISGALFHCRRCRKSYSSPLGHVCVTRNAAARGGRLAPKVTVTANCSTCGKPAGNPLTHVCAPKSDFKRRLAASKKAAAKTGAAKPKHLYQSCRDKDCERVACEAYREGRDEGYREGFAEGYDTGFEAGHAAGYAAGFAAGAALAAGG